MSQFKLNDEVQWTSSSNAKTKQKRGVIVAVVPPRVSLNVPWEYRRMFDGMYGRDHESYFVAVERVGRKGQRLVTLLYWPRVSALKLVKKEPTS